MRQVFLLLLALIALTSCDKKRSSLQGFVVLPLSKSLHEARPDDLLDNIEEYRMIPLETSDSVLLGQCTIDGVTSNYYIISDQGTVYFFDTNGKFDSKFNKQGNGPGEYLSINEILVNDIDKSLYIHDFQKRTIYQYTYDGRFINQFKNDSIASIGITRNGEFAASFSPSEPWIHQVGIYDGNWNPIQTFIRNDLLDNKPNMFIINAIKEFNGDACIYTKDTLFKITKEEVIPAVVIDKGPLSLPKEVATDFKKSKEREQYIWGDYGFWAGDYYFLYFNYDHRGYYDLWDLSSATLIGRNIHETFEESPGIPFQIGNRLMYLWPVFTQGNKIYCIPEEDDAVALYPEHDENDNPIILEITLSIHQYSL